MAVDTLGHLLAAHVTPANEQKRTQVVKLAAQVQELTGDAVEVVRAIRKKNPPSKRQSTALH
jgi:UDP-glucose 6-dehydrogenase